MYIDVRGVIEIDVTMPHTLLSPHQPDLCNPKRRDRYTTRPEHQDYRFPHQPSQGPARFGDGSKSHY